MNISTIKGIFDSNTYVVEQDGVILIVEAGATVKALKAALEKMNNTGSRGHPWPSAIFITHEHLDHVGHLADYCTAFPNCPVYCHSATLTELKTNAFNSNIASYLNHEIKPFATFENFKILTDNQIIKIGSFEIKAIFAPGHSHGSVVYLVNATETENSGTTESKPHIFTGDVLFRNSIGRTDLIPNGPELMQKSLRILQKLTFDTCYNGHSPSSSYADQQKNIAKHLE